MKPKLVWLALLLAAIPLFFLEIHHTQSMGGDDYSLYINEARSIATGKPFHATTYVFNKYNNYYSPPQYPPGYPLLLAPVIKAYGLGIAPMCYLNTFIACALLLSFFIFFRRHMGDVAAACLAICVAYSHCLLELKGSILSDIWALLPVMLYLIQRQQAGFPKWRLLLLGFLAAFAMQVRTQSVMLLAAEMVMLAIAVAEGFKQKQSVWKVVKAYPSLYIAGAAISFGLLLGKILFPVPETASGFYVQYLLSVLDKGVITLIRDNINTLISSISDCFYYQTEQSIRTAMVSVMQAGGLVGCIIGFALSVRRGISFADVFFVMICGLVLYYPIHDLRYFSPAIPIVFYYCYVAVARVLPALTITKPRYAGLAMTAFYLLTGFHEMAFAATHDVPGGFPVAKDSMAIAQLRQRVPDSSLVLCARPRMMALYTEKRCMIHAWQRTLVENKRICDSMGVRYVLIIDGIADDWYHRYLNEAAHPADSTVLAPGYTLYSVR